MNGQIELVQAGGLDGLSKEEIAEFAPGEGDYVLYLDDRWVMEDGQFVE